MLSYNVGEMDKINIDPINDWENKTERENQSNKKKEKVTNQNERSGKKMVAIK